MFSYPLFSLESMQKDHDFSGDDMTCSLYLTPYKKPTVSLSEPLQVWSSQSYNPSNVVLFKDDTGTIQFIGLI